MAPQEQKSQPQYPQCTFLMTGAPAENIEIIFHLTAYQAACRLSSQKTTVESILKMLRKRIKILKQMLV